MARDYDIVSFPSWLSIAAGTAMDQLMHPWVTRDEVVRMMQHNVAMEDKSLLTLADLGIEPVSMERVAFDYLGRYRVGGHFAEVEGYHVADELGKHGVGGAATSADK